MFLEHLEIVWETLKKSTKIEKKNVFNKNNKKLTEVDLVREGGGKDVGRDGSWTVCFHSNNLMSNVWRSYCK